MTGPPAGGHDVELVAFGGRANPRFPLTAEESAELTRLLAAAPPAGKAAPMIQSRPRLGYRGMLVRAGGRPWLDVAGGAATVLDGAGRSYEGAGAERLLAAAARRAGWGDVVGPGGGEERMPVDDESTEPENDAFGVAVDDFRGALTTALGPAETERRIVGLFEAYSAVLAEAAASPMVAAAAAERYEPYVRAVTDAFSGEEQRGELERAFRGYVEALQAAWTDLDPASVDPEDLASIADEMQWVAGVLGVVRATVPGAG